MPRLVQDVGVGQQDERRIAGGDSLLERPHLAHPSRRLGRAVQDVEIRRTAGALGGSVGGVVIDERHRERLGEARAVVLREERCDHGPDAFRLVARRHHDVDARSAQASHGRKLRP